MYYQIHEHKWIHCSEILKRTWQTKSCSYSEGSEDVESRDLCQWLSDIDGSCGLIQEEILSTRAVAIQSVANHSLQTRHSQVKLTYIFNLSKS